MVQVPVPLSDDARQFVDQQVVSGGYATAGEYIAGLIDAARLNAAPGKLETLLLAGLNSGPGREVTAEWFEQKKRDWAAKHHSRQAS